MRASISIMPMLIQLVVVLLVAGVILWGIQQFPIDATFMKLAKVAIVVVVAIYLIYALAGLLGGGAPFFPPYRR